MNADMPMFSVVIPAYLNERHLEEAVQSALNQDFPDPGIEVIIVYDPSSDNTENIIDELAASNGSITVIKNAERLGVAESRNIGMRKARGEYVAFLDADDIWHKEKLSRQHELIKRTGCGLCYSSYCFVNENGQRVGKPFIVAEEIDYGGLLYGNIIGTTTCVISSEIAKNFKMDNNFYHEDFVCWLTILRSGHRACGITDVLVDYRLRTGSRSWDKLKMPRHRWNVYRKFLKFSLIKCIWYWGIGVIRAVRKYWGAR